MQDKALASELLTTLEKTAACLNDCNVEWMVCGGAALALHGFEDGPVKDIDIVMTGAAAADLGQRYGWQNHADHSSSRFRSDYLLRPDFGLVPVELLGNFRIWDGSIWITVEPNGAEQIEVGAQTVFLPTRARLAEIFRLCGREKDLRRAGLTAHS